MLTVGEAIEEARDGHPAFTERNIPDSVIRRKLNRYQRELWAVVVDEDPQWTATTETITLSSYDFDTGFSPSATFRKPFGGEVKFEGDDRTARLRWVPYKNRKNPTVPWPAYYLNQTVYLCGIDTDWEAVTEVDVTFVTEPTDVTTNADEFDLPEGAEASLVARAELEMAMRAPMDGDGGRPPVDAKMSLFNRAENRFIQELEERDRAEESYVREEW